MPQSPSIVWFRQDLRLDDNPALHAALQRGGPIIALFIWAPDEEGEWPPGAASKWWLHQSLSRLTRHLEQLGSRLIIRQGPCLPILEALVRETGAAALFWNRRYEPAIIDRDARIQTALRQRLSRVDSFNAHLLFEPWTIATRAGTPFRVFTPFWKACLAGDAPPRPLPPPRFLPAPTHWPQSVPLSTLGLEPKHDWTSGLQAAWQPGAAGATAQVRQFLQTALSDYAEHRDRPDRPGSSRLSPYLHFGEISPRQLWHQIHDRLLPHAGSGVAQSVNAYLRELGWREFAYHLLYHFPHTPDRAMRAEFDGFPWQDEPTQLRAWQRGQTGYPLVDAGMRALWQTGWMHNRVRMVVASFLVKDLLVSWQQGAAWFWDTLVDADLANNTLGWQWSAGCGADAAPFFRIFNPVRQGQQFDPHGVYVRHWLPELANLSDKWIHRPWEAPPAVLAAAGITLGKTYPSPIVNHRDARQRALAALATIRKPTSTASHKRQG